MPAPGRAGAKFWLSVLTDLRNRGELERDVKPIYTAVNATAARAAVDDPAEKWGGRRPAVVVVGQRLGGVHPVPRLRRPDAGWRDLDDQ
jgi:transposase-like protein